MAFARGPRSFARMYASPVLLALLAVVTVAVAESQVQCDKTKCSGPLAYYEALKCTPVYEKPGDCCATRYNCDHLKERSRTKCYVNDNEYAIGEALRDEDANPCDISCFCNEGFDPNDKTARFSCAIVDCFFGPDPKPGCYRKQSLSDCCAGEEVCPENSEDGPVCNVNGKTYRDGESFTVEDEPNLRCVCQAGYEGKNVEPFCKRFDCNPGLHYATNIFNNCAPVYYSHQLPQTDCNLATRCQNVHDMVIQKENSRSTNDPADACYFGNMTMHRGDELNQATDYDSVCVRCVCEVPPMPTCLHLPYDECDITKHEPFIS